ncbi:hypothetical protein MEW_02791 [Candida albicans P60002]|nr:hypothetical protein MEW_02791 [Candida albicans P60002]
MLQSYEGIVYVQAGRCKRMLFFYMVLLCQ